MTQLEEDKKSLIELIEWYRDKYHKKDFGHREMIERIRSISDPKEFEPFEQIIDGWLS
jgi:hypothetical protein